MAMEEVDKRLAVFESRIEDLEQAMSTMADQILSLEGILNEIASHILPEDDLEDVETDDEQS